MFFFQNFYYLYQQCNKVKIQTDYTGHKKTSYTSYYTFDGRGEAGGGH